VDLVTSELRAERPHVALVRLEQLYPFPVEELAPILDAYPHARELAWLQEEPSNMGGWDFVRPLLETMLDERLPLRYIGRPRSASPSEGSAAWHAVTQRAIVEEAFAVEVAAASKQEAMSRS
jgi:2-oxoglutarate dehydrogenase E1 component